MGDAVVVVGGGIAGLGAALGLARRGIGVRLLDRDPPPPTRDADRAFDEWHRLGLPQFRQPHTFQARATEELQRLAPDVVEHLVASGVETTGFGLDLVPAAERRPEDSALRCLLCRRVRLELALRSAIEAEPGVTLTPLSVAKGVRLDRAGVRGVVLADGSTVATEWVIDAAGRRSPIARSLSEAGVAMPPERVQRCSYNYYTRHFRRLPQARQKPLWTVITVRNDLGHVVVLGFPADDETFAILLGAPSDLFPGLRALRRVDVWNRVAHALPHLREWISEDVAEPLTDVLVMASQQNLLRDFCLDGEPVAPGWLPIGDALCTTNPGLALGASLALTHAGAAGHAIASAKTRADAVSGYREAVFAEAAAWYEVAAASDRVRHHLLSGTPLSDDDIAVFDNEVLLRFGVGGGAATGDLELLRALLRRLHLVDGPYDWLNDPEVAGRARAFLDAHPASASEPSLGRLLDIVGDG